MISVAEARSRILAGLAPVGCEMIGLAAGLGRVLGADLRARVSHPPADVSAMDGFALRAADGVAGARLRVIGAAAAGHPFDGVCGPGEAVRLFTGSFVPAGADSVLIQENATVDAGVVVVNEAAAAGRHIRPLGQDFCQGDVLLPAGRRLSVRDIGLAAAGNHAWLKVARRPRVAILATGDEISLPGEVPGRGGIVNSNAAMLAAFVTSCGGEPYVLAAAADDATAIAAGAQAARGADLLVTSGGASIGAHDLVQAGLGREGFALDFWKIAMRPGKPLIFGRVGEMPVLGLPGNPVSSFVCAAVFLGPMLAAMLGEAETGPVLETARLRGSLPENDQREDFLRARLELQDGEVFAVPFAKQDSAMLRPLAQAEALIRRLPFATPAADGARIEIIRLDR